MKKIFLLIAVILLSVLTSCQMIDNTPKLNEVTFSNMITSMVKGETFEVEYTKQDGVTVEMESSDSSVATVEENVVTAVGIGKFTLRATFTLDKESKEYEFEIEVIEKEYSITYILENGILEDDVPTSYKEGDSFELSVPTRDGYEFLGWTTVIDSEEYITEITKNHTGDLVIYANWKEIETVIYSNIKYNLAGGTNPSNAPTKYEEGKSLTLPIPTRDGYEFLGLTKSSTSTQYIFVLSEIQKGDVTLYAKWKMQIIFSDIIYELDGGSNPENAVNKYEEGVGATLPVPTKYGYKFLGWSLTEGMLKQFLYLKKAM